MTSDDKEAAGALIYEFENRGEAFGKGYYTNTLGQDGTENMVARNVKNQRIHEVIRQTKN